MARGGVYERTGSDGRRVSWRVRFPDHTGRMRERTVPGHLSRTEARKLQARWAAEALLDHAGVTVRADRVTVDEYWRTVYLPAMERGDLRESTVTKRARIYRDHVRPHWGALPLSRCDEIAAEQFDALVSLETGEPLAKSTKRGVDRVLTAILNHAARRGEFGPGAAVKARRKKWDKPYTSPQKAPVVDRPTLTMTQVGDVLAHALTVPRDVTGQWTLTAALVLCFALGLRRGELAPLRRSHVKPRSDGGYDVRVRAPKTATWTTAPIFGDPAAVLGRYLEIRDRALRAHGGEAAESDVLFPVWTARRIRGGVCTRVGGERRTYVISDAWWSAVKSRGDIPAGFRLHDTRGVFIKTLGAHLGARATQEAARHKDGRVTEHYLAAEGNEASEQAGAVWGQLRVPAVVADEPARAAARKDKALAALAELDPDTLARIAAAAAHPEPLDTDTENGE